MIESLFPGGKGGDDEKVKVSSNDTTAGFLNGKLVAGTNVTLTEGSDGGDETLTIASADTNDAVKVSSNDTTPGDLEAKLVAGTNITLTTNNDGSNETLTITSADTNDAVKVSSNDTTPGDLEAKLVAGTNITLTTNNDGSNETLTIAAAGGVTGFTGSQNTASPNNTVNASRLLVDATSTNADFVAQPKGQGSVLGQLPDGTVTGGNKRGLLSVDFGTQRLNADEVASGIWSAIIAGRYMKASGSNSATLGGLKGTASGDSAVVLGGGYGDTASTASGNGSVILGGYGSNTASGISAIAAGRSSTASGTYSIALGYGALASQQYAQAVGFNTQATGGNAYAFGNDCRAIGNHSQATGVESEASKDRQRVFSAGKFANRGDCQEEHFVQRRETTDAVQTELSNGGAAPAAATRMAIASDATYTFSGLVTARRTDADNESAGWEIKGVIDNNAGTTALVGSVTVTALGDDSAGTWLVAVEADNTNDALVIKVTGENSKTIRWGATVTLMKVAG